MNTTAKNSQLSAVAARLRMTREAFGMEQAEFAERAGIARNAYNQYEQAKRLPRVDVAAKLCNTYGLTLDWIFLGNLAGLPFNIANAIQSKKSVKLATIDA